MPFMTRIPSDLARFGLQVELVPGWQTRGSSAFAPACVVDHWTAGPRGTKARPSLKVVVDGRPGLDGPLCNVYLARDGVCVVVAAGRANHAGAGGFRGLVGNSAAYGIEAESGGDGDWTPAQLDAYPRLNAALLSGLGRGASWVVGHNEWAPDRKIDIRDIIAAVRARTGSILANPEDDGMPLTDDDVQRVARAVVDRQVSGDRPLWQVLAALDSRDPNVNPVAQAVVDRTVVGDLTLWQALQQQAGLLQAVASRDATQIAAAVPADLAKQVADELVARLKA